MYASGRPTGQIKAYILGHLPFLIIDEPEALSQPLALLSLFARLGSSSQTLAEALAVYRYAGSTLLVVFDG
jgi:hypothetical protein